MGLTTGKFLGNIFKQVVPAGTVNGTNKDFTLPSTPHSTAVLMVFVNGLLASDYTLSGATITFTDAPSLAQTINCFYVEK